MKVENSKNKKLVNDISKLSFEALMNRLEEITAILSSQKIDLEQMISLYEEGDLVKNRCLSILENTKMKFEKISTKNDKEHTE